MFKPTFAAALTCARDLAVVTLAAVGAAAFVDDLRWRRANPRAAGASTFAASTSPTVCEPEPLHGWLYELSSYGGPTRRVRPACEEERAVTDETRHLDGTGIFAVLDDSSILRRDDADYPPRQGQSATYRWVAP